MYPVELLPFHLVDLHPQEGQLRGEQRVSGGNPPKEEQEEDRDQPAGGLQAGVGHHRRGHFAGHIKEGEASQPVR